MSILVGRGADERVRMNTGELVCGINEEKELGVKVEVKEEVVKTEDIPSKEEVTETPKKKKTKKHSND